MTKIQNLKQFIQRHIIMLATPLVLLLSFTPRAVHAGVLNNIADFLSGIPAAIIYAVVAIVAMISGFFVDFCGGFLNVVTGPFFVTLKYTNNDFVNLGLGITKNFVNLILVVFLVYIAISIALRLGDQRAIKKALVNLVIIALLVNFAPVFCGLIIDACNIVQNYFLAGISKGVSGIAANSRNMSSIGNELMGVLFKNPGTKIALLFKTVLIIIMNLSIGFAFLLFAAIFFFRLIAIWILVVLSPLAFVAWVLPATKKFWTLWWNQFIQWSIIGIPLSFFLYLVMATTTILNTVFQTKMNLSNTSADTAGLLNMVLPYMAITALLFIGFIFGLKTSAMGAGSLIKGFEAARKKAISRTLKGTGRAVMGAEGTILGATGGAMRGAGKAIANDAGKTVADYNQFRRSSMAWSRPRALGKTVQSWWQRRKTNIQEIPKKGNEISEKVNKAAEKATKWVASPTAVGKTFKEAWKSKEGVLGAIRDVGETFYKTTFKPPKKRPKKKGKEGEEIDNIFCPVCGEKNDSSNNFCSNCGEKLG